VALNRDYVGRTFEAPHPYEVTRVKIAEFATAIGEQSSYCFDPDAARKAGYPDVIAPPTFAIVIATTSNAQLTHDSGLGLNYAMVVHGGDWVVAKSTIEEIRPIGKHTSMTTRTDIETTDGEHVCTSRNTLVERGE